MSDIILSEELDGAILHEEGDVLLQAIYSAGPGIVMQPVIEPVSLDEMKKHLRVDIDDDDELIQAMITAARTHIENITRRAFLTQTWDKCLQSWPAANFIKLPYGNLQSVTFIKWIDADGIENIIDEKDYIVERNGALVGRIVLPAGKGWPSGSLSASNPITIRFTCGWATPILVPGPIKSAIKLFCADLYERRGDAVIGAAVYENKTMGVLLPSYKLWDGM